MAVGGTALNGPTWNTIENLWAAQTSGIGTQITTLTNDIQKALETKNTEEANRLTATMQGLLQIQKSLNECMGALNELLKKRSEPVQSPFRV